MAGLPRVVLSGNLVADPEIRFSQAGNAILKMRVACNERVRDKSSGEWVNGSTTFLSVTMFGKRAEAVAGALSKGSRVLITGELMQRQWETNTGEKRADYEVRVDELAPIPTEKSQQGSGSDWGSGSGSWGDQDAEPPF